MKLQIGSNLMEEVEGLHNAYPYAFHAVDLQTTLVPWHWHEALEFDYVVDGCVKVSTTGQTHVFHSGEGFFMNGNVLSSMTGDGACSMESHLFHPVFLGGHFKSVFETKYLNPVIQNKNIELVPLRGQTAEQTAIAGKLRQLAALQRQPDTELQTRNLLSEIWLLLLEELRNMELPEQDVSSRTQERLQTMLAFVHQNYAQKLTLEQIASAAAVSTRECLRCFRTGIQQSPVEYLVSYRIRMAQKQLEVTTLPVTDIALNTGFNSPAYFSKLFKTHTGMTPNAYRAKALSLGVKKE